MDKLEFKESTTPCYEGWLAFEADNYRVVHYDIKLTGYTLEYSPHWRAYKRISHLKGHPFGDYVDQKNTDYQTREEAEQACRVDAKEAAK